MMPRPSWERWMVKVLASTTSTLLTSWIPPAQPKHFPAFELAAVPSIENFASAAETGWPLSNTASARITILTVLGSTTVTDCARFGIYLLVEGVHVIKGA